jgi:hypothetical protein
MKIFLSLILLAMTSNLIIAQQQTLVGTEIENGGYGALLLKVGPINGSTGFFVGTQGGWIINHRFVLGGMFNGLTNTVEIEGLENTKLRVDYGGVLLEYIFAPDKLIHFNVQSVIGGGGVYYEVVDYQNPSSNINYSADSFFVWEPGANAIVNVTKNFRIGIGMTYRYVTGVAYEDLTNSDLRGINGQFSLKFGKF